MVVVELNVPRISQASFDPKEFSGLYDRVDRITRAFKVVVRAQIGVESHPVEHVVHAGRT